jgi:hypothetical protein
MILPIDSGPWELETLLLRAQLLINPETLGLTILTDTLPQLIDGIPLRVRAVAVDISRAQFMFNPTDCTQQSVAATLSSSGGAVAQASAPFHLAGCAKLHFSPAVAVSAQAGTGRAARNTASLTVRIRATAGQANVHSLSVLLPARLRPRLTALEHSCPQSTFTADPQSCPQQSMVGTGSITTPVLAASLAGGVYLVSQGKNAPPRLILSLAGEGVRLDVAADITIATAHGDAVRATFAALPDVPLSSLSFNLPAGPNALLGYQRDICSGALSVPIAMTAENQASVARSLRVRATGCPRRPAKRGHSPGRR